MKFVYFVAFKYMYIFFFSQVCLSFGLLNVCARACVFVLIIIIRYLCYAFQDLCPSPSACSKLCKLYERAVGDYLNIDDSVLSDSLIIFSDSLEQDNKTRELE